MIGHIKRLFSGDMIYGAPPMPVRGYDATGRDVPIVPRTRTNTVGGTGHYAGTYRRMSPMVLNSALVAVLAPVTGPGSANQSIGMAGHLVRPSALNTYISPDGGL